MMKKLIVIFAALLLIALSLVGCGDDKDKTEPTKATTAATAAPTEPATLTPDETQAQADDDTQAQEVEDDTQAQDGELDEDGYIPESEAIANVRKLAGTGAQIVGSYKGYSPDGAKAWIITVAPVTKGDGPETVTYYSGYQFCYAEGAEGEESTDADTDDDTDDGAEEDGYIPESEAIANVKKQAGTGALILGSYKGYSPDGAKAWIITVAPVSKSEDAETVTYYSGYQFCYPAE